VSLTGSMKIRILLTLSALVTLSGCSSTNIAELTKALANDPAIVKVKIGSVYGTVDFTRIGCVTNGVSITPDGTITVKP